MQFPVKLIIKEWGSEIAVALKNHCVTTFDLFFREARGQVCEAVSVNTIFKTVVSSLSYWTIVLTVRYNN